MMDRFRGMNSPSTITITPSLRDEIDKSLIRAFAGSRGIHSPEIIFHTIIRRTRLQ